MTIRKITIDNSVKFITESEKLQEIQTKHDKELLTPSKVNQKNLTKQ